MREARRAAVALAATALLAGCATPLARYAVAGDAIATPLDGRIGDAARGRALLINRTDANCVLCHAFPDPAVPFPGDVGPSLAGVGARLSSGQLRLRIVDSRAVDPASVMPSYYRVDGLLGVAPAYRKRPVLTAQAIEDIVTYLESLR